MKSSDSLLSALADLLYERSTKELKQEVAACIGIVGYVVSTESDRYFSWIFPRFFTEHGDDVKILLLSALAVTLRQDASGGSLHQNMPLVMTKCQTILENADIPDLLVAVVDVVQQIVKSHPSCFHSHFRVSQNSLVLTSMLLFDSMSFY